MYFISYQDRNKLKKISEMDRIFLEQPVTNSPENTTRKCLIKSKYFWTAIVLCMVSGLLLAGYLTVKSVIGSRNKPPYGKLNNENQMKEQADKELQESLGKYRRPRYENQKYALALLRVHELFEMKDILKKSCLIVSFST